MEAVQFEIKWELLCYKWEYIIRNIPYNFDSDERTCKKNTKEQKKETGNKNENKIKKKKLIWSFISVGSHAHKEALQIRGCSSELRAYSSVWNTYI